MNKFFEQGKTSWEGSCVYLILANKMIFWKHEMLLIMLKIKDGSYSYK